VLAPFVQQVQPADMKSMRKAKQAPDDKQHSPAGAIPTARLYKG